jgi:hypothetical protein
MSQTVATLKTSAKTASSPGLVATDQSPARELARMLLVWGLAIAVAIVAGLALAELMAWLLAPGWSAAASFHR